MGNSKLAIKKRYLKILFYQSTLFYLGITFSNIIKN